MPSLSIWMRLSLAMLEVYRAGATGRLGRVIWYRFRGRLGQLPNRGFTPRLPASEHFEMKAAEFLQHFMPGDVIVEVREDLEGGLIVIFESGYRLVCGPSWKWERNEPSKPIQNGTV